MRLKRSRVHPYYHKARITGKDKEGGTYEEYGAATAFSGEVWPAGGKVQAEQYGVRLGYIQNVRIEGDYRIYPDEKGRIHYIFPSGLDVMEKDGLCLNCGKDGGPDYRIVSIRPYRYLTLEAEKL